MTLSAVIGISLLTLVPGISGGSETYARELVRALARVGELDYRVYLPTIAPDAADGLSARIVRSYRAGRTMPARIAAMSLAAARPGPVRTELELDRLEVIHFPLSVMLPPVRQPPAVTTVLDLQHEFLPGFFSRPELTYRRLVYGWTVRRSRLVIAISRYVADTLVDRLSVPPENVRVIYLGIDHERFFPAERERGSFLLYPANRWPHKNHERLFAAFGLMRRERPKLRLLLTGAGHEGKPLPDGVEVRGHVAPDELVELYRTATALAFPSLYEGFGQPPVEAMACGCPVVASNVTALPEVCDGAARLFDPTSPEDIAAALSEVLDDPGPWIERGLERARTFTWDRCARAHDEVYRELVSE